MPSGVRGGAAGCEVLGRGVVERALARPTGRARHPMGGYGVARTSDPGAPTGPDRPDRSSQGAQTLRRVQGVCEVHTGSAKSVHMGPDRPVPRQPDTLAHPSPSHAHCAPPLAHFAPRNATSHGTHGVRGQPAACAVGLHGVRPDPAGPALRPPARADRRHPHTSNVPSALRCGSRRSRRHGPRPHPETERSADGDERPGRHAGALPGPRPHRSRVALLLPSGSGVTLLQTRGVPAATPEPCPGHVRIAAGWPCSYPVAAVPPCCKPGASRRRRRSPARATSASQQGGPAPTQWQRCHPAANPGRPGGDAGALPGPRPHRSRVALLLPSRSGATLLQNPGRRPPHRH